MWEEKHAAYGKRSTQPRAWTLHGYQSTSSAVLKVLHKVMKCESAAISYVDATPSMSWHHCQGMQAASALRRIRGGRRDHGQSAP